MEDVKYILKTASDDELSLKVLISALIKRYKMIVLFAASCTLVAGVYVFMKPDFYASKAIVTSNIFVKNEIQPILTASQELINDNAFGALSEMLSITLEQAESIQKMTFEPMLPEEPNAAFILEIELQGTDTTILPEALTGIIDHLNHNKYLHTRIVKRRNQLDTLTTNLTKQIGELRSFKMETKDAMSSAEGVMIYPVSIHTELVNLQERLLHLSEERRDLSMIQYIQEPTQPEKPKGPNRLLIILATLATSLAIAVFVVIGLVVFEP